MHPTSPGPARPKKQFPKWLKITLSAFAVLFVLGAIFGKAPEKPNTLAAPASPATTTGTTSSSPAAVTYTVANVTDAATLEVTGSDGTRKTVHVLGVLAPASGAGCYWTESLGWAGGILVGKVIRLGADTAQGAAVTMADGTDYATQAVQGGYLKYVAEANSSILLAAETTARQAGTGLWGPPCNGIINAPAPLIQPAPQTTAVPEPPATTKGAPKPPPVRTTEEQPPPEPDPVVYYKNCSEVKAAHAAPLHRGEPGYRSGLDRDGDGVACET